MTNKFNISFCFVLLSFLCSCTYSPESDGLPDRETVLTPAELAEVDKEEAYWNSLGSGSGSSSSCAESGTWENSKGYISFTCTSFSLSLYSTNYGADAVLITKGTYSKSGTSMSYTVTSVELDCSCQYAKLDTSVKGPYSEYLSVSGNTLTWGTEKFTR